MPLPEPRDPATGAVLPDLAQARKVLETEAAAILALVPRLDARFGRAVELLQEAAVLRKDRQLHDALRQYPAIGRLRELDRASQDAVDLLEPRIPGVRKAHAQWDKVPVGQAAQHPVERQRDEFGMLPARHVKRHHGEEGQDCLVVMVRDLKANFFVCRCRVSRQVCKGFRHRRRCGRKIEKKPDLSQVDLRRDV